MAGSTTTRWQNKPLLYRGLSSAAKAKDDCNAEKDSFRYAPPDFTLEDDGSESQKEETEPSSYMPPDFSVVMEEEDDSDGFEEDDDGEMETALPTKRRRTRAMTAQSESSWMDKNSRFQGNLRQKEPKREASRKPPREQKRSDSSRAKEGEEEPRRNRTFRQDFRGTRVFVQGIPSHVNWQQLKDHFRIAGEVVFASVSTDPGTGQSKGCGVVQYETTEMAQYAIQVMRDHPLDGEDLYVREDVQEKQGEKKLKNPMPRGGTKRSTVPATWTCADESSVEFLTDEEESSVYSLIRARDEARKRRNYDAADDMREELKLKYGVFLDDGLKMWWISPDGRRVPQSISDIKGDGRWAGSLMKPWRQIPTIPDNDACVNADLVNALLAQRDIARREKDFGTADALLEEARTSPDGDLNLRIHDESRTWRVWTDEPPPRQLLYGEEDSAQKTPTEQCLDIVAEHAPEKLPEIERVLEKFKGREYAILKKLKQRYLK